MRDVIFNEDCLTGLARMPDESVQMVCTSPPYFGLRSYLPTGHEQKALEVGAEQSPEAYVEKLVSVFREVRRVLKPTGVLFCNLGDSYGKGKQLLGMPWRVAFALQADGWILRQDIIYAKPTPMPEPVKDRCVKAHEYIFLLSKSPQYFYDADAIREKTGRECEPSKYAAVKASGSWPSARTRAHNGALKTQPHLTHPLGRNKRSIWNITPDADRLAHHARFPEELVETCLHAGSKPGDTVLDPFMGSGTVARVAVRWQRHYLGCELNPAYLDLSDKRLTNVQINLLGMPLSDAS
jgi:DNA modification methylase